MYNNLFLKLVSCASLMISSTSVFAHGSVGDPMSRAFACEAERRQYGEGLKSDTCKSLYAQYPNALWTWHEIDGRYDDKNSTPYEAIKTQLRQSAAGICAGYNKNYQLLNDGSTDWTFSEIDSKKDYVLRWAAPAEHFNDTDGFAIFITKPYTLPTEKLTFDDFEELLVFQNLIDGEYGKTTIQNYDGTATQAISRAVTKNNQGSVLLTPAELTMYSKVSQLFESEYRIRIPAGAMEKHRYGSSSRHVIASVWWRSYGSKEYFVSCSDIVLK
jgi:predicted carbohydrate-binding protein with CBM5 and CBM33 domain